GAPAVVKYTNRESMNSTNNEFNRLAPFSRGWNRRVPTWLTFIAGNPERAGVPIAGWKYMPTRKPTAPAGKAPESLGSIDGPVRQQHQINEIIGDTQQLLAESPYVRQQFMKKLADCKAVEEYSKVVEE